MQIDGKDFTGLTDKQAEWQLHHMKGADMVWHLGIFFLVFAALMISALPMPLVVLLQYPFLFLAISNTEAANDRRWEEYLNWYCGSLWLDNLEEVE
jgi:hypothetical protein